MYQLWGTSIGKRYGRFMSYGGKKLIEIKWIKVGVQRGFKIQLGWFFIHFIKCGKKFILEFTISN